MNARCSCRNSFVDAALFMSDFWNLIEPRFVVVRGESYGQFNNVTRARTTAAKFICNRRSFTTVWKADLSYTYVWPRDLTQHDILKLQAAGTADGRDQTTMGAWSAGALIHGSISKATESTGVRQR